MSRAKPTKKQKIFADLVASGTGQVDAYREAYNSHGSANTERVEAHRLARRPNVARMIEEREVENARLAARSARSRSRWIIERLCQEADSDDSPPAVRVRALEILGKASGLFSGEDREQARSGSTELELVAELEARLTEILPAMGVIDAESTETETEENGKEKNEPPTPL